MHHSAYNLATSGIITDGSRGSILSNHSISRHHDGAPGRYKSSGIILGSAPGAANSRAGTASTAITAFMSSRRTRASSASRQPEIRFRRSIAISDRTGARSTARRHEWCASSRLTSSSSACQSVSSTQRSSDMRAVSSTPRTRAAGTARSSSSCLRVSGLEYKTFANAQSRYMSWRNIIRSPPRSLRVWLSTRASTTREG